MDCGFPCRVNFRFLQDELAKHMLEYFYENSEVLIYDAVFKVASLSVKSESYEDIFKDVKETVESFRLRFETPTYLASLGTEYHFMFPDLLGSFLPRYNLWIQREIPLKGN
jgi:hypothetical protein